MSNQRIIICDDIKANLSEVISEISYDKLFILVDEHTKKLCIPIIQDLSLIENSELICIGAEDINKNLETISYVWKEMGDRCASRHSLLINIGGGMVTDLGGFAASTFKRGIKYINIPTTLLAMVDASVGGKTGINFNGLKNEIGVFSPAEAVLIDTEFLKTLDTNNILSGYAEILKHGLISDTKHWADLINFDFNEIDYKKLQKIVETSVKVKENIVDQDPFEEGIRKALNLGHTAGHAFESLALLNKRPILHGYAVAFGIVCELYLSMQRCQFPKDKMYQTIQFIKSNYGVFCYDCKEYEKLYELMKHDKKNSDGIINFTLLADIGDIKINNSASKEDIYSMLDFYREIMGC